MPNAKQIEELEEREKLIMEWMRNDEAFKSLARKFGKGAKPANLEPQERAAVDVEQKQKEMLDWLGKDEAFKGLAKKFGASYPKLSSKK